MRRLLLSAHHLRGGAARQARKKVRDALTRIGGQDGAALAGITGAPATAHYRNKAQYPVGRDADGNIVTGFYRTAQPRHRAHRALPDSSPRPRTASRPRCGRGCRNLTCRPYDYAAKRGAVRHIYVRVGEKSGESQLTLIAATRKLPALDELVRRLRAREPSLTGIPDQPQPAGGQRHPWAIGPMCSGASPCWRTGCAATPSCSRPRRFIRSTTRRPKGCMRARWISPG